MRRTCFAAAVAALLSAAAAPTVAAQGVTAVVISDESQLPGGPASQGQLGDFLLSNAKAAFVIESAAHAHGEAPSGGNLVDAVTLPESDDLLEHVVVAISGLPRQVVYDFVTIDSDGTSGTAVVRAEGHDSDNPDMHASTTYSLGRDDRYLEIVTTLTNSGSSQVDSYLVGDAIDWSYGDNFAPGYGFEVTGVPTFSEWIGSHSDSTSYAYGKPSGTLHGEHGYGWSDAWLFNGSIEPAATVTLTRYLSVGTPGLSSASDAILGAQGVSTGRLAGRVTDSTNDEPLQGALVDCAVNGVAPYTRCVAKGSGDYAASLPPVRFRLDTSADGYIEDFDTVTVAQAGTTRVDFSLTPSDWAGGGGDTLTVVMRPIITIPAIVLEGNSFTIEAIAPPTTTDWSAQLSRGDYSRNLSITNADYELGHERWYLSARVPEGVPDEMYDLVVKASGGIADTVAHSVAVRDSIPSNFYFVHVTDTHLPTHRFYGDQGWDTDTTEMNDFRAVIDDINIANPAFVLLTGDVVNEGETEDFLGHRCFTKAQRILKELDVPVFAVAGNHDMGGWESTPPPPGTARKSWWRFFGWRYLAAPPPEDAIYTENYSFDYGGAHFTGLEAYDNYDAWHLPIYGHESFTARQMEWLSRDLQLADPEAPKILFYHYDFDHELDLSALGVDCGLWGHIHTNSGSITSRPLNLATDNVCDGNRSMRFLSVKNGVVYASETIRAGDDGEKLRVSYDVPNDGTNYRMTATIVNANRQSYDDALLRFHVPADSLPYRTNYGEIAQTLVDGDVATCYVHFGIPSQNSTYVSIEPTGETQTPSDVPLLRQSYPNPARGGTTLSFVLTSRAEATLEIFDVNGRRVRVLQDGPADVGDNDVFWDLRGKDGTRVASGIYFCRLKTSGRTETKKLVVLR